MVLPASFDGSEAIPSPLEPSDYEWSGIWKMVQSDEMWFLISFDACYRNLSSVWTPSIGHIECVWWLKWGALVQVLILGCYVVNLEILRFWTMILKCDVCELLMMIPTVLGH